MGSIFLPAVAGNDGALMEFGAAAVNAHVDRRVEEVKSLHAPCRTSWKAPALKLASLALERTVHR
jgi:hypothetical protein